MELRGLEFRQLVTISIVIAFIVVIGFSPAFQTQTTVYGSGFEGLDWQIEAVEVITDISAGWPNPTISRGIYTDDNPPASASVWDWGVKRVHIDFDGRHAGLPDLFIEGGYAAHCDGQGNEKPTSYHSQFTKTTIVRQGRTWEVQYYLHYFKFEITVSSHALGDYEYGKHLRYVRIWIKMGVKHWIYRKDIDQAWAGILNSQVLTIANDDQSQSQTDLTPSHQGAGFDLYGTDYAMRTSGINFPKYNKYLSPSNIPYQALIPITVNDYSASKNFVTGKEFNPWTQIENISGVLITREFDMTQEEYIKPEAPLINEKGPIEQLLQLLEDLLADLIPFKWLIIAAILIAVVIFSIIILVIVGGGILIFGKVLGD